MFKHKGVSNMMMFAGNERAAQFVHIIERMQSCELVDMDYIITRMTEDDGSGHYNMGIPHKDILSRIKRPSRIVMARPQEPRNSNVVEWKTLMERMKNRRLPE